MGSSVRLTSSPDVVTTVKKSPHATLVTFSGMPWTIVGLECSVPLLGSKPSCPWSFEPHVMQSPASMMVCNGMVTVRWCVCVCVCVCMCVCMCVCVYVCVCV